MGDSKPKDNKERTAGSGSRAIAERERAGTGFEDRPSGAFSAKGLADKQKERPTGSYSGPVPQRATGSHPQVPRPLGTHSGPKPSGNAPPPRATGERERVTQKPQSTRTTTGTVTAVGATPGATTAPKQLTQHQKAALSSEFQSTAHMNRVRSVVGGTDERQRDDDDEDDEATSLGVTYDGKTPAKELASRDLFKAVQAPVQSREGRRSARLYRQVIYQFAVGFNPRYEPDAPGRFRSHILVWDVSRAMNCEIPHFWGAKELSLGQTVDWLRLEGPQRGWVKGHADDALEAVSAGMLAIAMPKEVRVKQLGVVLPDPPDKDGRPRLAGCAVKIGGNLSLYEALGVYAADYFVHP